MFLSYIDLGLTSTQYDALHETLALMESGNLIHISLNDLKGFQFILDKSEARKPPKIFNMHCWIGEVKCSSVGCIGGTSELLSGVPNLWDGKIEEGSTLEELFYPRMGALGDSITVEQAAVQLRKYLETGHHDWETPHRET